MNNSRRSHSYRRGWGAACLVVAATLVAGTAVQARGWEEGQMSFVDNGKIRLGIDLSIGGAVTYLAESQHPGAMINMINSFDWGRQVQMSFYSGPVPFHPPGTTLSPAWAGLGWNPIQSGDAYHHGSRVLSHQNDGKTIRVRCVPMIWPLDNVPAESTFDSTYRLVGNTVEVTSRIENARADHAQYAGRAQELPAVYTNGPWYKLVSYLGDSPFTGAPTTVLVDRNDGKGWPWVSFYSPEHWAALLDEHNHGLGVFNPTAFRFSGGFAGAPKGSGGPKDSQTGYIAPNEDQILDHNIDYAYHYVLVVGTVDEIRKYASEHGRAPSPPAWSFQRDRQGWIYQGTTDSGWPIRGELRLNPGEHDAAMLSPVTFWRAAGAGRVSITAAFDAPGELQVTAEPLTGADRRDWPAWGPGSERPAKTMIGPATVPVKADGRFHTYEVDLRGQPGYDGSLMRLKIILPPIKRAARIKEIRLVR